VTRTKNERRVRGGRDKIVRDVEKGLSNSWVRRAWLNMRYFQELNKALPVEELILVAGRAGVGKSSRVRKDLVRILFSFYYVKEKATIEFFRECERRRRHCR